MKQYRDLGSYDPWWINAFFLVFMVVMGGMCLWTMIF
jgi:hypothetical protein